MPKKLRKKKLSKLTQIKRPSENKDEDVSDCDSSSPRRRREGEPPIDLFVNWEPRGLSLGVDERFDALEEIIYPHNHHLDYSCNEDREELEELYDERVGFRRTA